MRYTRKSFAIKKVFAVMGPGGGPSVTLSANRPDSVDQVKDVAVKSAGVRWAVCAVALIVLAGDQVSKSLVLAARPGPTSSGEVSVRLVRNTGASFGLGAGHPLVIVLTAIVVIAIVAALLARTRSRAAAVCLAAVLGGALGNLADRLFRVPGLGRGAVVDWIHVAFYPATFNLADLAIRVGAVGAVIAMLDIRVRGASWRGRRSPAADSLATRDHQADA
jgi:signal peptidase II